MVIGHLPFGGLNHKEIEDWAGTSLHNSFHSIAHVGNGFFEATFTKAEVVAETLQNSHYIQSGEVIFSTWSHDFSSQKDESVAQI